MAIVETDLPVLGAKGDGPFMDKGKPSMVEGEGQMPKKVEDCVTDDGGERDEMEKEKEVLLSHEAISTNFETFVAYLRSYQGRRSVVCRSYTSPTVR